MTDLNKERELFELFELNKRPCATPASLFERFDSNELGKDEKHYVGKYVDSYMQEKWELWQKAKAQAVPEGYVVVPREPTQKMINESQGLCQPQDVYKAMLRLSEFKAQDKVVIEGDKRVWNIDTINSNGFHATTINKPTRCLIHVFSDQEVRHATNEEILEASESGAEG
ncbi:hypothetical protein J6I82_05050 [Acinetobacter baumannii]|uniref:Uncharacterized protein n=1 Tax=Acinetobacter baumannii TaxID=470 RepID=A0A246A742_ACIBA|nr:hypothetical protein [Acinetobacter baumannii]MCA4424283.1 hypothetical protein [Acinetobacter baumannii]MCG6619016.1 hypothetical protein [Acinetobacter baumannii]MEE1858008.1 hypothetical protein [Acinetobacter baumannii]NCG58433.1 hypothetical protein [Acinetobacter baumannii]NDW42630.1 hypothetical protein [Acinetobacter baumannii]